MAANDITYGTITVLPNISRLNSNVINLAEAFGEIEGLGELGNNIYIEVPINASSTDGTYDLHLVESQDGVEWTDNIDPADEGDVAAKLSDAILIESSSTVFNASNRTEVRFHVQIAMLSSAKFIGFVLVNKSGQSIPVSGSAGNSVTYKIAA